MSIATMAFFKAAYALCLKLGAVSIGASAGAIAGRGEEAPPGLRTRSRLEERRWLLMTGIQYARSPGTRNRLMHCARPSPIKKSRPREVPRAVRAACDMAKYRLARSRSRILVN